jgi:hypothetical protein
MYTIYHPPYKLLDWIDIDKLNWEELSENPNAIHLLEQNQDKIDWDNLSRNPNAVFLLEQNQDKIDWDTLSCNPNALSILERNEDKISWNRFCQGDRKKSIAGAAAISFLERNLDKSDWSNLSHNPNAIHLLEQNQEKINWYNLCMNTNAVHLLEQNPDKIDWNYLCSNNCPRAVRLIEKNLDKLAIADWVYNISRNPYAIHLIEKNLVDIITIIHETDELYAQQALDTDENVESMDGYGWERISANPNAISLLEKYPDKIAWHMLSGNPNAIHLLEQNQDKIHYCHQNPDFVPSSISENPSIFKIDYKQLYKQIEPFHEELMQKCFHPDRVKYYLEKYEYDILEEEYLDVLNEVYGKLYTF